MVFGFGGLFLLLRLLSRDQFGVWVLFTTIAAFVEVGRMGLLQNALVRDLSSQDKSEHPTINTASLALSGGLSVLSAVLLMAFSGPISQHWHVPQLAALLRVYAFTTLLLTPLYQFNFIQMANLDYRGIFFANFVRQGLFFGFVVYLYATSQGTTDADILTKMAWVQLIAAVPAATIAWWFVRKYLVFSRQVSSRWFFRLLNFGKFNLGTNLSTMSFKSVDKWMLESLLHSPAIVGSYELAVRITNLVEAPVNALAVIFFPQSARRMAEEGVGAIRQLYEKSVGVLLSMIIPFMVGVWVMAPWIVTLIGSEKYADTAPILRLTVLFGLFVPFAVQFGTVLDSIGKPNVNFWYTTLGAGLNLICNYFFISKFGILGAAYGTLAAFSVMFVIMQIVLYRTIGSKPWRVFGHILPFYRDMWRMVSQKLGI